jgi:hypothetical protein
MILCSAEQKQNPQPKLQNVTRRSEVGTVSECTSVGNPSDKSIDEYWPVVMPESGALTLSTPFLDVLMKLRGIVRFRSEEVPVRHRLSSPE